MYVPFINYGFLASGYSDLTINIWDPAREELLKSLKWLVATKEPLIREHLTTKISWH